MTDAPLLFIISLMWGAMGMVLSFDWFSFYTVIVTWFVILINREYREKITTDEHSY